MASAYSTPVTAVQVGSYFVGQYYQVLRQQPDLVHQFYSDASSMIRIDGDANDKASSIMQIHTCIMSLNFTSIEIKTINSLDSWNGGILVMISGTVKSKEFSGRRKFVQMFFLAPQEKGYFVLNDIFQFVDDGMIYQHPTPLLSENYFDPQRNASTPHPEPPVSDYGLEEEAREYINSVHIEDDPIDKYSVPEQQQQLELDTEVVVEENLPVEETSVSLQGVVNNVHETSSVVIEEPVGEPPKKTYASILQVAKGQPSPPIAAQPSWSSQTVSEWNHTPQPPVQQLNTAFSAVPESALEAAEEGFAQEEGELKSVYVRNLSSDVTEAEIEHEFKNFGQIKPDGVFIRSRTDIGVCYAFVEFEDIAGVHNALMASPIQLGGRQVYIEERRPNSSGVSRGGRRGRGRGSYPTDSIRGRFGGRSLGGRGNNLVSGDYNRIRGNGFHPRGSRYD